MGRRGKEWGGEGRNGNYILTDENTCPTLKSGILGNYSIGVNTDSSSLGN